MNKTMSIQAKHEMVEALRESYKVSKKKTKQELLNGLIAATGLTRKHAIKLLSSHTRHQPKKTRGRKARYGDDVVQALIMLWQVGGKICSKRLVPFLPELVASLERHGHMHLPDTVKQDVLSVSCATFDRLIQAERHRHLSGQTTTQPGSFLKQHIKVRTFNDWHETQPGFFEADLVAHCGTRAEGVFVNTLTLTDIHTTWTECIAIIRRSADDVILALDTARQLLPFDMLGLDVDNGSEFINYDLLAYCEQHKITFTRSRPYKKNDQAHVEERNGSIVRSVIGYERYQTEQAWQAMCELYAVLRLYVNFFQPSLKLSKKIRQGSRTTKHYQKAMTPYQRVMAGEHMSQAQKQLLSEQFHQLDP